MKRQGGKGQIPKNAVCITSAELKRMKGETVQHQILKSLTGKTKDQIQHTEKMEKAKARKEYILALDANAKGAQKREGEKNMEKKIQAIRKQAQEKMDQNEDIVKLLNTCSQRAAAFTIRDQQLKDKAIREKKERDYEESMVLAMEIDRLKEIEEREQEEKARNKKRIEDRKVIEDQIDSRRQQRLLQEEARDQENREMLEMIKKYQAEDDEKAMNRKEAAKRTQLEIIKRNEEDIAAKEARMQREKEEEELIIAYQLQQDEKLRQREAEEAEANKQKKELQKKLLESQTKSMDKQAEIDELRARRAMEENERKHRHKELLEAQKRKKDMATLLQARKNQEEAKRISKKQVAVIEQEEYEAAMKHAHGMAEREREEAKAVQVKNAEFIKILQQQIHENEKARQERGREKNEEGLKAKEKMALERAKLEAIRDKIVQDMKLKGVNEKYFGEMRSLDIEKFLLR